MPQRLDRWVVLKSGSDLSAPDSDSYFLALKISTYSGQGVGKRGVVKANHGIIYSGTRCSETSEYELPSRAELGMLRYPIRVQMASKSEKLDPMSRLDYGKTYTFQVSSLVYDLGIVHRDSIPALVGQFRQVLHRLAGGGERNTEGADDDSEASEDELEEEA
ncbi:hypothetical protein AC579_5802 [Pseudocercospora musae]|uniref:DUF6590 domain-containing protein n=1 Tax=Pseudocercospora musae TaxID=113226 RepID=A0A139IRT5_9PEZI|nr:hypothetical protein AC579_5802 [Pseudocercospora musae]